MHAVTHSIAMVSKTTNVTYSPLQWSYGVTCWELFTGGKIPYPGVDPISLSSLLESGHRLDKPKNAACSEEMYDNPTPSCTADTNTIHACMQAHTHTAHAHKGRPRIVIWTLTFCSLSRHKFTWLFTSGNDILACLSWFITVILLLA